MSEQSGNRVGSTPFAAITVMSGSGLTWQPTNSASMERKGEDDTGQAPLKHTWFLHGNMRGSARWNRTPLGALAKPWHCLPLQPARGGGGQFLLAANGQAFSIPLERSHTCHLTGWGIYQFTCRGHKEVNRLQWRFTSYASGVEGKVALLSVQLRLERLSD